MKESMPLKFTEVEVEWDGAGRDPIRFTDEDGCLGDVKVRNALVGNGHDMNWQTYAKRQFKGGNYVRVFESITDLYPTYVESKQVHIKDNKTKTLNVSFGDNKEFGGDKPNFLQGNLSAGMPRIFYWYNIAAADILGRYYDWAYEKGFRQKRSVDVIMPAIGGTAYFNILSNNINMTIGSGPTKNDFRDWVYTLLHEGSHALHAHSSPSNPINFADGIIQPTVHSLQSISNPMVAWTEGFAEFMPAAYLTSRNGVGLYGNEQTITGIPNTKKSSKVASSSFAEDATRRVGLVKISGSSKIFQHGTPAMGAAEGYVLGLLWDLYDGHASTEQHPKQILIGTGVVPYNVALVSAKENKNRAALQVCQVENTAPRSYRGLPQGHPQARKGALEMASDCLSDISLISGPISSRMYDNVTEFGNAVMKAAGSASDSSLVDGIRYEVLKLYSINGMNEALPDTNDYRRYAQWNASVSTRVKAHGIGATAPDQLATVNVATMRLPVKVDGKIFKSQWLSASCFLVNSSESEKCYTVIDDSRPDSQQRYIQLRLSRPKFCTQNASSKLGTREVSPVYVLLDDQINPVALPVRGLCDVAMDGSAPSFSSNPKNF